MGSYTSKYALSDRLVCGECGTLFQRCTWKRKTMTRIVWRCISRVDYGSRYCHNSPTLDEEPLQRSILAAINSSMSPKCELIDEVTEALRIELAVKRADRATVEDIDRKIKAREQEFQYLFDSMQDSEDITERAKDFQRITEELAELKVEKERYLELEKDENAAAKRLDTAVDVLESSSSKITEWDESMIRQLVDMVKVVSADKLIVYLRGGVEIEQEMLW